MNQSPTRNELLDQVRQLESTLRFEETLQDLSNTNQSFCKTLFEHMLYEVHVWQLVRDSSGNIATWKLIDANPAALKNWGKPLEAINGCTADVIFPNSEATKTFMPVVTRIFADKKPYVWENYFADTGQILHMISIPIGDAFISCGIDVTDIKKIESQVVMTQQRLAIATKAARIGVWEYNLETKALVWDESMHKIYGVAPSAPVLPYNTWSDGVHKDDILSATHDLEEAIAHKTDFESEFRIVRRDNGQVRHIVARAAFHEGINGESDRLIGANIDITDRKNAEQEMEVLAYFDTLTGLPNRSMINDQLSQSIALCGRTH